MPVPENLAHIHRCQHAKDDGTLCGSPALSGRSFCYFHERQRKAHAPSRPYRKAQFCRRTDFFNVHTPDDVMLALNQVMNAILTHQLSPQEAGSILFALQSASVCAARNVRRVSPISSVGKAAKSLSAAFSTRAKNSMGALFNSHFGLSGPDGFFADCPAVAPTHRPRTVAEIFEMFPGFDDLRAMLSPEDITLIEKDGVPTPFLK